MECCPLNLNTKQYTNKMEKILNTHYTKCGNVVFIAKEIKPTFGGYYSVWVGTNCTDFGLSLDASISLFNQFKRY